MNFYTDPDHDFQDAFPTPPPQPSFGPETGYPPGRYRCLKRVDGRIETTLWSVESPDVDEYYAQLRAQAATETDGGTADTTRTDDEAASPTTAHDAAVPSEDSNSGSSLENADYSPLAKDLIQQAQDGSSAARIGLIGLSLFDDLESSDADDAPDDEID